MTSTGLQSEHIHQLRCLSLDRSVIIIGGHQSKPEAVSLSDSESLFIDGIVTSRYISTDPFIIFFKHLFWINNIAAIGPTQKRLHWMTIHCLVRFNIVEIPKN